MPTPDVPFSPVLDAATEAARLRELRDLDVLDTPPEEAFDDLVWLATTLCEAPIGLLSLVDERRQWLKARSGLEVESTPREVAFCAHALTAGELMVVEDAQADPRFVENPLVTGPPHIRFYAGAVLFGHDALPLGTLCVIDRRPRGLTPLQRDGLLRLARQASALLRGRRERAMVQQQARSVAQLLEVLPDGVVTCDAEGTLREFNGTARAWLGVDARTVPREQWNRYFDLYDVQGQRQLSVDESPLLRAQRGEQVRDTRIAVHATGQPPRVVSCTADPLRDVRGALVGAVCVLHDVTGLLAAQERALVEAQRFAGAFASTSLGMALVSLTGQWLEVNAALCTMLGRTREELLATDFQQLTHPDDLAKDLRLAQDLQAGRITSCELDKRYLHRSGRVIHARLSAALVCDANGRPLHLVAQIQDQTQRVEAEQRLRDSERQLRTIADHVPAMIGHVDATLRYRFVNLPYAQWFRRTPEDIIGRAMHEVLRPEHYAALQPQLARVLTGETLTFEMDVTSADGELRHMHASYIPDRGAGAGDADAAEDRCTGFHLMVHDVTAQTRLARMLHERAMTDELTGLPNRAAWNDELPRALARAQRAGVAAVLMFLDLNGFKQINDTHGHATGDAVLVEFARRLRATLRRSDYIARLSGDEFVVFLDRVTSPQPEVTHIARKLLRACGPDFEHDGQRLRVQPAIGLAVQNGPDYDADALMRQADQAMYDAKRDRSQPFCLRT